MFDVEVEVRSLSLKLNYEAQSSMLNFEDAYIYIFISCRTRSDSSVHVNLRKSKTHVEHRESINPVIISVSSPIVSMSRRCIRRVSNRSTSHLSTSGVLYSL